MNACVHLKYMCSLTLVLIIYIMQLSCCINFPSAGLCCYDGSSRPNHCICSMLNARPEADILTLQMLKKKITYPYFEHDIDLEG